MSDANVDTGRFSTFYDVARQRSKHDHVSQTADGEPHSGSRQTREDDTGGGPVAIDDIAETIDRAPYLTVPPLPPLYPLTSALLQLRKNFRSSTWGPHVVERNSTSSTACSQSRRNSANEDTDEQFGIDMIRRCARAAEGDLLAQHLAEHVAGFCTSPAVDRTGQWEVSVELDPAVLAKTQLHLRLSGLALALRFDSHDPRCRHLICDNINELKTRLEARLGGHIAVEVTVL
ncbi:type III secretion system protein SctP [Burkholderia sp. MSMB1826]|uniref:type III secretion system protein SctP n=1 Tax=Burkholderia sp. MSMB1826 TaxID=1637875 RepID=UPI0015CFF3EB|nr:type III secretion system protein SctP [Burkholderia sp. MSMB1826]